MAPVTGTYTFTTTSDDGVRLYVNGQLLVDNWTDHAATQNSGTLSLVAGQKYDIRLEFYERGGLATARLSWAYPGQAFRSSRNPSCTRHLPSINLLRSMLVLTARLRCPPGPH